MAWPHRWAPALVGVPLFVALVLATAPDAAYLVMLAAHFGPWPVLAVLLAVLAYRFLGRKLIRRARDWIARRGG